MDLSPTPTNPLNAEYRANGASLFYWHYRDTGLQTIQIVGPAAKELMRTLINDAYLPVFENKIEAALSSGQRSEILRGLGAIAFKHAGDPTPYARALVAPFRAHADEEIRALAAKAAH